MPTNSNSGTPYLALQTASFQPTTPYSHGLDKIYAFETLNPKTVKTLLVKEEKEKLKPSEREEEESEYLFPFAEPLEKSMPSLKLMAPVELLSLSPFALRALHSHEITTTGQLIHLGKEKLLQMKGLGLGHVEEILQKVAQFIPKNAKSLKIDFLSLVKILLHEASQKEKFIFLSRFELEHLFQISASDFHEMQALSLDAKKLLFLKAKEQILPHLPVLQQALRNIAIHYLNPFLEKRHGFSRQEEIHEYMLFCSTIDEKKTTDAIFRLFSHLLADAFVFHPYLFQVCNSVYAMKSTTKNAFDEVVHTALSYFYSPTAEFPFSVLHSFVLKDLALRWMGYEEGFVEKVIKCSSSFKLLRKTDGTVAVQLNTMI